MKVSQSSRMISMMGREGAGEACCREEEAEKEEGGTGEIIFGAANNKFCPHHTSAERGLPLGWPSFSS